MIKREVFKRVETALAILEKLVIETDQVGIDNRALTDAIRVLRTIPPEAAKDDKEPQE